jgi:sugar phosphate isomerase/epimerase
MKTSRRFFIKKTGLATLAAPFGLHTLAGCQNKTTQTQQTTDLLVGQGIEKFGLQLWTVKEDMAKDPKGTLKAIAEMGYKQIESFTGEKGIFWGMPSKDFQTYLHDLGLEMISSHVNPDFTVKKETEDEFKKLVEEAAAVGAKYLINPFPGEISSAEDWKKVAEGLNRQGLITKSNGIKMGYHNHHFEFLPTSDQSIPEETLLKNTDPQLVDFELDLYWIVKAGQDPEKWLKNYADRFKLVHIKDLYKIEKVKQIEASEKPEGNFWPLGASTILGQGRIDFPKILKTAKQNGVQQFIVEQERFDASSPMQDIKKDADYMEKFKFS